MPFRPIALYALAEEFTQTDEDALAASLGTDDAGRLIFNTTLAKTRYWNGTAFEDSAVIVSLTQLGTGTPSSANYLRGDGSWTAQSASVAWGGITGTLSNQSDLQTALNAKEAANANIQAHVVSAHAPSNAQNNSDITKAEIEAKLTGQIATHTHAGGGGSVSAARVVLTKAFPAKRNQRVNVVDAAVGTSARVMVWVSGIADGLPDAGDLVDLQAMRASANAGSFDVDMDFLTPWAGSLSVDYVVFA